MPRNMLAQLLRGQNSFAPPPDNQNALAQDRPGNALAGTWTERLARALWNPQALGLDRPLPMEGRATFLPAIRPPGSDHPQWALPGALAGMVNALTLPSRAAGGTGPQTPEEKAAEALNFAGNVSLDSYALSRALKNALPPTDEPSMTVGATVYHGTPHQFDQFDASKIGTGEGAQAYGHGLYFAENPAVANQYKVIGKGALDPLAAESDAYLYHVDIPDEAIGRMLNWDKPLSEQQGILSRLPKHWRSEASQLTGQQLYNNLQSLGYSPKGASEMLKSWGIPGIRYRDAGSRAGAEGTHNIVLFDDKLAKITKRE